MEALIWHQKNNSAIILPLKMSDRYYQTLLTVYSLGALGNIISIVVFSRRMFHGSASTLSHQLLCTLETVYMGIVSWGVTIIHSQMILTKTVCLTLFYFMHVVNVICNWMVVLVTIERLTSVILPLQVRILWTKKRLLIVFFTISTLTLVLYSGLFIMTTKLDALVTNSSTVFACLTHYKDVNLEVARAWLEIIFMHSMPCIILVIGNGLIIVGLGRHKAFLKRHDISQPGYRLPSKYRDTSLHTLDDLSLSNNNVEISHMDLSTFMTTPVRITYLHLPSLTAGTTQTDVNKDPKLRSESHATEDLGCCFMIADDGQHTNVRSQCINNLLNEMRQQNVQTSVAKKNQTELLGTFITVTSPHLDLAVDMKDLLQLQNKSNPTKTSADNPRSVGQKQHRKMSQQSQSSQLRKERTMTITLLLINFTFLGTKTPYFIHSMTLPGFPDKSTVLTLQEAELKLHFVILASLFNAMSFILYCLAGSKFREELSKMVCGAVVKVKHFLCKMKFK